MVICLLTELMRPSTATVAFNGEDYSCHLISSNQTTASIIRSLCNTGVSVLSKSWFGINKIHAPNVQFICFSYRRGRVLFLDG